MAGSEKVGTLVYDIEIDTAGLIEGQRRLQAELASLRGNLGGLNATINRTEQATRSAGSAMSSLSAVAKGLAAAITVHQITEYANAWVDVTNKLANSVRANEQVADVTQRVFDISQQTRSGLSATATLYGRLERATRSAGTSTADLAKLTTTINKGLAVSGATTEEASSTMIQLSQALASGVLRGEEFNSISENGSRLAVALADSLGVTIGQLRNMAAQGKLTTEVVVNGLLKQSDAIGKEFANTAQTMGQAFTVATNNITKFVGENTNVNTTLKVFNSTIVTLSENLDSVSSIIGAAAVVMGSRFVGALVAATSARVSDAIAARAQASATSDAALAAQNAARIATVKAALDRESAISSLALAQAEYNVAKGSAAEAFALENLNAIKSIAIQRSAAYAEAQLAQTAATNAATAAAAAATTTIGGLARGALSLIGGPAGAAVIAAAAIFYFYQKSQQAKQESIDFADKLDNLISKMKSMSQVQLAAEIDKANKSITAQNGVLSDTKSQLDEVNSRLASAEKAVAGLGEGSLFYSNAVEKLNALQSQQTQLTAQLENETTKLSQTISKTGILRAQMNGTFEQGIDLLKRDGHEASVTAGLITQLGSALDIAGKAKDRFNSSSLQVPVSAAGQKILDQLQQENDLLEIQDKRQRAVKKARLEAINAGEQNQNVIDQAGELAGKSYDLQKADQERTKAANEAASAAKKQANAQESVAQKLANLKQQSEQSAASTDDLSRAQAILTAQQSLGKSATQADIVLAGQYAAKKWDVANALKAQAAAEKLIPVVKENTSYQQDVKDLQAALQGKTISQDQYNATSEQLEQQHQANLAKIRANQAAGVNPAQEAIGQIDPVQQLANQHAQQLALIQAFETQKGMLTAKGLALMDAENTAFEKKRTDAQWEILSQQSLGYEAMTAGFDAFSGSASNALTGLLTGTMSLSEAMSSLGNTVLNAVINSFVQAGAEWVKQLIIQQTLGSAVSAASAGEAALLATAWATPAALASLATAGGNAIPAQAGMTATVGMAQGMAVVGARKNGGPVSAGSLYEVGEGGMPEIYKASNGSQYMIPGNNGSVISNKDLQGSGAGNISVSHVVHLYSSGVQVQNQTSQSNGTLLLETFISDLEGGGPMSNSLQSTFGLTRKATGDY